MLLELVAYKVDLDVPLTYLMCLINLLAGLLRFTEMTLELMSII